MIIDSNISYMRTYVEQCTSYYRSHATLIDSLIGASSVTTPHFARCFRQQTKQKDENFFKNDLTIRAENTNVFVNHIPLFCFVTFTYFNLIMFRISEESKGYICGAFSKLA